MNQLDQNDTASNRPSNCVNEQHALLAAIVASADDAIIGSDLSGNILSWNHAAEILFGYSVTAIYQRPFTSLFPSGQLPDHLSLIKLLQQGASIGHFETMRRCQDGTELPVALTISAIRDEGDNIIGLSLIARDFSVGYRIAARLTQSERHFRQVVDAAPNAMVMIDRRGLIEMVNTQAETIFGYTRSELLGKPLEILIPSRFQRHHPSLRTGYFANPVSRTMGQGRELYGLRKDGTEFPVEIGLNPIETTDGIKVLSAIVDITERKRQEERFRLVVEAAPNAMVMIDSQGKIEMVNAQTEAIFGYAREELLGQPMEVLIPARFRAHHPGLRSNFFTQPSSRSMGSGRDLFGLRKDGSEFPVEIGLNPIETADGIKVLSAIVDISERKRQEERFRLVVEAAPNAMVMIDSLGKIEMVNAQTEHLFGYQREELLGQPMEILIPARFRPQHPGLRSSYFASPSTRAMGTGRDLFGLRKDGSEFQIEIGLNPIQTADGLKVLSAIVDISERKRFTDELSRRNQELNSFAYVASHDLKSPLRGVDQLATWLTEDLAGKIDDETNEHLRLMRMRIKRMEKLLDDLLLYFRAGQSGGSVERIDVAELVRDVFDLCCSDKSFRLELQGEFPRYHTHKVPLELVFRNLISNSIKHHDTRQGCIVVQAIPNDQWLEFAVCDDGPGIAPEHRERVFAMFQTLRPRDEVEGSGMGLAIIKKTIESLGGSIALSDNQPRGAIFRFTWPRKTVEA
ncbi:PAS domain-containing sensor histidine kinase [Undibacterium umbellatum]|uniref:histidine kinase n=1 Tax=Undibacterium umbellatum TaxID=2762300 RepID=A0ABR6Z838_9BURK|nr:PAS domain S-box protein [Undibacterium umbellatum]MBC3907933.1 PAS domain S-box protein [Undibacterium umbellatum]